MELRHLRYFVMVAEELHFGRAASRLSISQPPLSQQIRQLEDELGFPLLFRNKHRVELTEAGKVFLEEARLILARTEKAQIAAERAHQGATGRLEIAFVGSTTYNIVPWVQKYRILFPSVHLVLHQMKTENQLQALHEGSIHMGVVRSQVQSPFLMNNLIQHEPLVVVIPESHPLSNRKTLRVEDLANEPFIITSRRNGASYYDTVIHICHQSGYYPQIALEAPEILTIVAFVSAGIGISLVPASFQEQQNNGVVYRKLEGGDVSLEMGFIWKKNNETQVLRTFLDMVHKMGKGDL
jgi:DNA-binding transcriptional LysR family regulator